MSPLIIFTALLPVAILIWHICRKDRLSPEPTGQLVKAFAFGLLSLPASLFISIPLAIVGLWSFDSVGLLGGISKSFFGAAIPEEIAKFIMLWLVLRKNRYFDEKMDGIVYAVFVSLGFAAIENIGYLFSNAHMFLIVGTARAIFSVPGHFCFGILMGYYYSLAKFYPESRKKHKALTLIAPILAHGIFNSLLYAIGEVPILLALAVMVLFLFFCYKLWKRGSRSIAEHLQRDTIES